MNTITHAQNFLGEPTHELSKNPNPSKPSNRKSFFSVPHWEKGSNLKNKAEGEWRLSNADRKKIKKFNKEYERNKEK